MGDRYAYDIESSGTGAPYFLIRPKNATLQEGRNARFVTECDGTPNPRSMLSTCNLKAYFLNSYQF